MNLSRTIFQRSTFGLIFLFLFFICFSLNDISYGADISLAWDPPVNSPVPIAGYYVYWGTESGNYINRTNNGVNTTCTIAGLDADRNYYFAVTSYDRYFEESKYSNEISVNIPTAQQTTTTTQTSGTTSGTTDQTAQQTTTTNQTPVANAGPDQTAVPGTDVLLDGSNSTDPDGDSLSYLWTQTQGPTVTLDNPTAAKPTFICPDESQVTVLAFNLTVTDPQGLKSNDSCLVTIEPTSDSEPLPDLTGTWLSIGKKRRRTNCSIFCRFLVENIGDQNAQNVLIKFYLSKDQSFDSTDKFLAEDTVRSVNQGASVKLSLRVDLSNIPQDGSNYVLIAVIDPANAVAEKDEGNNTIISQYIL